MPVVLVVEDNRITRAMYAAGLSGYGFKVEEARGIQQAKTYLQTGTTPQVIVLDMNLFDGSGTELIHHIREEMQRDDIKIVVTTGSPIDPWKLFELGADVFLNKPVDLSNLINMIRTVSN
jgi:CheY-like chemotaxis protein